MSEIVPILEDETGFDRLLVFTLPGRHARGRLARLGPVLEEVLAAHDYPAPVKRLLAEALALTALIGGLLKDQGAQMTLQAQAEGGAIALLVCDYRQGELRGYAEFDVEKAAILEASPSLEALFGKGHLAITFDLSETGQRYQGIVALEGASLSSACEGYFAQSEQVPTLIRLGIEFDGRNCVAGGLIVQHLAEGEDGRERLHVRMDHPEWEHVEMLAQTTRYEELVDPGLSLEALVWRLFHEEREVRIEPGARLSRGCRCSIEHYQAVLSRFPEQDLEDMRNEYGVITVDCAFCSRLFEVEI